MSISLPPNYQPDEYTQMVVRLMQTSYDNILISGRAGTGKSTLIEYYKKETKRKYILLASTGVAAMNIGGQTIHSFFGFPPRVLAENDPDIKSLPKGNPKANLLAQLDTIIIDEVSMIRADLLDGIDQFLRLQFSTDQPFGGLQIVLVGDSFQLSPVESRSQPEEHGSMFQPRTYKSPYFFSAEAFKKGQFKLFELKHVYRQTAGIFLDLLSEVRTGKVSQNTIDELNQRVMEHVDKTGTTPILLTTTNWIADEENLKQLKALPGRLYEFDATIDRIFPPNLARADVLLQLKVGARVMMINNDSLRRWSNGSLGTLIEVFEDPDEGYLLRVQFDKGNTEAVPAYTWENISYKYNQNTQEVGKEIKGSITQYPVKLAWAVTVHKSQGLTFDKLRLDVGSGAFAPGQLYVALSRCRTFDGITLLRPLEQRDIIVAEVVRAFAEWATKKMEDQDNTPNYTASRKPARIQATVADAAKETEQKAIKAKELKQAKNVAEGKKANEGAKYTTEDLKKIQQGFEAEVSFLEIAESLDRKPSAVGTKMKSMGLIQSFSVNPPYILVPIDNYDGPQVPEFVQDPDKITIIEDDRLLAFLNKTEDPFNALAEFQLSIGSLLGKMARLGVIPEAGIVLGNVTFRWQHQKNTSSE